MISFILRSAIVSCALACASANATVYQYTGNNFPDGSHITASADVSFSGAGAYIFGQGLNSFELKTYDASNIVLASLSTTDANYNINGWVNYVTLDASQNVTKWFLSAYVLRVFIVTLGNDFSAPSNCYCGTEEFYTIYGQHNLSPDNAGTWTASAAVPEPGSLALLGLGLTGLGFTMRKKHSAV